MQANIYSEVWGFCSHITVVTNPPVVLKLWDSLLVINSVR